jgi:hypothetical protein
VSFKPILLACKVSTSAYNQVMSRQPHMPHHFT